MRAAVLLVVTAACLRGHGPPTPTTGAIAGQIRDQDTGAPLSGANLAIQRDGDLRPATLLSARDGGYELARLRPGRYDVTASYGGVTVDVRGVEVVAGRTIAADLDLPLGRPETIHLDFGDAHGDEIRRYHPAGADPATGGLRGTVTDALTHERVPGAIVTATSPALPQAVQVVTDDRGQFELTSLAPAEYSVSAYYTVARHGTISVERNRIPVAGGEVSVVPLFVEMQP